MIYLIAGHHNNDSGAIGVDNIKESDLTKIVRDLVYNYVKEIKPNAFVTKDDDNDNLSKVISKIKDKITKDDILLDFHYNSASNNTATGTECIVSDNAGSKSIYLANNICEIVSKHTKLKNRGVKKEGETPRKKLAILNMKGSAVIVELGFINNRNDVEVISDNLHEICKDIACIILK